MSRSLYSLDRESAQKLLTKNNLAKPMRAPGVAPVPEENADFAQIKESPAVSAPTTKVRTTPIKAVTSHPPAASAPLPTIPDPRQVEQEEKWLQAQVRIKELEETLSQVALDDEKMASLKQKGAELEGHNRLLEDQVEALRLKLETSEQKAERMAATVESLKNFRDEAEKLGLELSEVRTRLSAKESEAIGLAEAREKITALELEKGVLIGAQKTWESESREFEAKLVSQGIEASKLQADMRQLEHDLELEKAKTAASSLDAEQISKLRKQVETARDLLNKAAEDNVRLEKERNEIKGKFQILETEKAETSKQNQLLDEEKQQISAKSKELDSSLLKAREDIRQLNQDLETEKFRVTVLQPDADKLPLIRKDLENKSELLERALESGTRLEKERDELKELLGILEKEKSQLADGKQTAEADRTQFSGKLNELGKELLQAQTEVQQLKEDLEKEKARPLPAGHQEELQKLRSELTLSQELLARTSEEKTATGKELVEWKEKVSVLEIEVGKAKDALKQAVMAYHDARTQTPGPAVS